MNNVTIHPLAPDARPGDFLTAAESDRARRMVLAGGSGFLGQSLAAHFQNAGWEVVILTRRPSPEQFASRVVLWDGSTPGEWQRELEGASCVINLSGRSVNCRYNARNRQEIMESRVAPTRALGEALRQCRRPPPVWLNASTATIYKHSYDRAMDERGEIGATREAKDAFAVDVAKTWEHALTDAATPSVRKVALRTAMVLGCGRNSVLPVLLRLVRFGLGGKMGDGQQFVSWIHETDFCRAAEWIMDHPEIEGPVNLAAPSPLPNVEMMQILREICGRSFGLPASQLMLETGAFFLRTETELIIKSRRVIPGKLTETGFQFQFVSFAAACVNLMGVINAERDPASDKVR